MKNIKKIILMLLVVVGLITSMNVLNVEAKTAPSKVTVKAKSSLYYYTEKNGTDYISGYNFYRKQLTDDTYAYCVSNIKTSVPAGKTLSSKGAITDKGLDYIIKNGWPNKSMTGDAKKDYYITQSAIWEYFDETRGSSNWHSTSFTASSTGMKKHVYNLVNGAKLANKTEEVEPSLSVSIGSTSMLLNNEKTHFVSSPIVVKLTNTKGTYTVELTNAPEGTILKNEKGETKSEFKDGENFVVYVPASSVKVGTQGNISLKVKATGVTYKTFYYTTGNKTYQDIAPSETYEITTDLVSNPLLLSFAKEQTKVKISKQDITSKQELPGAMLSIKDKNGKVVEEWVSGDEPHYIEGLEPGEYTLSEVIAPEGYVLSKETINFTVKDDGSVTSVVMYNSKEIITKVKISKQDITNKKELPGATLVIKDKDGNVMDEWVSGNEPHYIEGLKAGDYTLTEKIAPNGYILSEETITFTVKDDGSVTNVVMYNAPYVEVPKTDLNVSSLTIIIASVLITLGTGMVVYYVKYTK